VSEATTLRSALVTLADTKLLLGYHYGEWTFGPPAIEAGIAACSMAQEEFGHARLLNGILKREFDLVIDPLEDTRVPTEFASIAFLDRPFETWADVVAANAVVDTALSLELRAFRDGTFEPLARVVPKMLLEERFHWTHAEGWVRVIEDRVGRAADALHTSLERALRDVAAFFGPPGHDAALVDDGVKSESDETLRDRLFTRIASALDEPAVAGLAKADGRWALETPLDVSRWDPARHRTDSGGPEPSMLEELRGTKNVAFKSA